MGHDLPRGSLQAEHHRYLCCSVSFSLTWRRKDELAAILKLGQAVGYTQVKGRIKSQALHNGMSWHNKKIHTN